jgi:hypothetical protein
MYAIMRYNYGEEREGEHMCERQRAQVTVRARERENCSLYVTMEHNNANTLNVICRTWSNIMFF